MPAKQLESAGLKPDTWYPLETIAKILTPEVSRDDSFSIVGQQKIASLLEAGALQFKRASNGDRIVSFTKPPVSPGVALQSAGIPAAAAEKAIETVKSLTASGQGVTPLPVPTRPPRTPEERQQRRVHGYFNAAFKANRKKYGLPEALMIEAATMGLRGIVNTAAIGASGAAAIPGLMLAIPGLAILSKMGPEGMAIDAASSTAMNTSTIAEDIAHGVMDAAMTPAEYVWKKTSGAFPNKRIRRIVEAPFRLQYAAKHSESLDGAELLEQMVAQVKTWARLSGLPEAQITTDDAKHALQTVVQKLQ